jgi:hypothetical protein
VDLLLTGSDFFRSAFLLPPSPRREAGTEADGIRARNFFIAALPLSGFASFGFSTTLVGSGFFTFFRRGPEGLRRVFTFENLPTNGWSDDLSFRESAFTLVALLRMNISLSGRFKGLVPYFCNKLEGLTADGPVNIT